jgi:hypothetical protein
MPSQGSQESEGSKEERVERKELKAESSRLKAKS